MTRETVAARALVAHRAWVLVVAGLSMVAVHAAHDVSALIVCTWVPVVAVDVFANRACAIFTGLDGALAAVIAGTFDGRVGTSRVPAAGIFRAWVPVVAIQGDRSGADAVFTHISDGAGVSVVAESLDRLIVAASGSVTAVDGADVVVAAVDRLSDAFTGLAVVGHGA